VDATVRDPFVGHELDNRYEVERRVARGGMATVYVALDRRLGREVALKIMHSHLADDEQFVARFIREARSAAKLSHPNVVQVYDQGSHDGVLYLAMEYLPGRTLREVMAERGSFTPHEALSVLEPVLDALASAHRAGLIHRDVKPENVILTDDGRVKVADFGLARAATGTATSGSLIGTAAYLAPEIVARGAVDTRVDVYAAGVLLFEMLTGKQPFTGEIPIHVAFQHVHDEIPAPSRVVLGLPTHLDELVTTATARDPGRRPPDAGAMLALVREARARLPRPGGQEPSPATRAEALGRSRAADRPTIHQETRAMPLGGLSRRDLRALSGPVVRTEDELAVRRRRVHLVLGAVLALCLFMILSIWWTAAGPGAYMATPRVVGMTMERAQETLDGVGLRSRIEEVFSDTVSPGAVAATRPKPGASVHKGGVVVLAISQGSEFVRVPDVTGKEISVARTELMDAGMVIDRVNYSDIGDVPQGSVISTQPMATQLVRRGSKINLVVSSGPPAVQVPGVVGQDEKKAKQILEQAGFKVKVERTSDTFVPEGQVARQDPQAGVELATGETVTVFLSEGAPTVVVPDVTGMSVDEARRVLREAGFQMRREGPRWFDQVLWQSPGGGSQAEPGSTVTVHTA